MDEINDDYDMANIALVLYNEGHVNVVGVNRVFEISRAEPPDYENVYKLSDYKQITTTYVEYLHVDGTVHTDPIDIDLTDLHERATVLRDEQDLALAESQGLTPDPDE